MPRSVEVTGTEVSRRHKANKCNVLIIISEKDGVSWKDVIKPSSEIVECAIAKGGWGGQVHLAWVASLQINTEANFVQVEKEFIINTLHKPTLRIQNKPCRSQ